MLAFTDFGRHYNQTELARAKEQKHPTVHVWRGEQVFISFAVGPLTNGKIPDISIDLPTNWTVEIGVVRETLAYIGRGMTWGEIPAGPNKPAPDYVQPLVDLQTPPVPYLNCLAAITVPAEDYSELPVETVIHVGEEILPLTLQVVGPGAMPLDPQLFSLELWEYPYAVARFYHISADQLFGPEHERLTKENLQKYSAMGGHSITTTIVEDPWHHQTYDAYPSLVQWTRAADGFHFDYTNFDRYVQWNLDLGIDRKIKCFSILPWENEIKYRDAQGAWVTEKPAVGSDRWRAIWTAFLTDFIGHLNEKKWFDRTYMALDERPIDEMKTVIDFLSHFKTASGQPLKLSGAVNYQTVATDVLDHYQDISINQADIGDPHAFKQFVADRQAKGLETTFYNCVGNYPSMFALSEPIETAYLLWYFASLGVDGFLRWALDGWVEDPFKSVNHWYWESGDPFLLYPHREGDTAPYLSPRIMMMAHTLGQIRQWRLLAASTATQDTPGVKALTAYLDTLIDTPLPAKTVNAYGAAVGVDENADQQYMHKTVAKIEALLVRAGME